MPRGVDICPGCDSREIVRINEFDAIACRCCQVWLEDACSDPTCGFCSRRPADASGANWDDPWNTDYGPDAAE